MSCESTFATETKHIMKAVHRLLSKTVIGIVFKVAHEQLDGQVHREAYMGNYKEIKQDLYGWI